MPLETIASGSGAYWLVEPLPWLLVFRGVQPRQTSHLLRRLYLTKDAGVNPGDDRFLEKTRSLLARRPSTLEEIAGISCLPLQDENRIVDSRIPSQSIALHRVGDRTFFRTVSRC